MKKKFLLLLMCIFPTLLVAQKSLLHFRDSKFVIAQFTDLHWTPTSPKCSETTATIRAVLESEKPDLAVLTGDVVTDTPAGEGWMAVATLFNEAEIPFVVVMGNHDAEYMEKDAIYDLLLKFPFYVGQKGPENITGCGNCVLPIYDSKEKEQIMALLYCIDSNDYQPNKFYGPYDWIHFDQIAWYRDQSTSFTARNNGYPVPSLAFFHIPLVEYDQVASQGKLVGNKLEEEAHYSKVNAGLFSSFLDKKDVMGVFAGHDHDNDYIGMHMGIALGYGRVTGADAYGSLTRGARMIQLYEGESKFDSWVATPSGREVAYYYPSGMNSDEEQNLSYQQALDVSSDRHGVAYTYYEGNCKRVSDIVSCNRLQEGVMPTISITEAIAKDHFAYQFRSLIQIPERGVYNFYTFSDDGSMLYIDGQVVVDNDGGHSGYRADGKIALEKGFHELCVSYFEDYMGQELEVGYSGRNVVETSLTENLLFLPTDESNPK